MDESSNASAPSRLKLDLSKGRRLRRSIRYQDLRGGDVFDLPTAHRATVGKFRNGQRAWLLSISLFEVKRDQTIVLSIDSERVVVVIGVLHHYRQTATSTSTRGRCRG